MTASTTSSRGRRADRPAYRCGDCGWTTPRWVGRCGECQAWGTVGEAEPAAAGRTAARAVPVPALPIGQVPSEGTTTWATGLPELDRVLGGGVVSGAVVLLAGEPGTGKSTLLLEVAGAAAASGHTVLYVTAEESAAQVRQRAERIGALRPRLLLAAETDLATVLGHIEATSPDLLVLDSVQTVASTLVDAPAGSVGQVREVAASLIREAKSRAMATLLIGHVTKDGAIAGPRALEHLVDVVCQFDGDRHGRLRMLRAVKNRYGPTDELGCFEMTDSGVAGVVDPTHLFCTRHPQPVPGTSVAVTLEGRRPLVAEVQALTLPSAGPPRRSTTGVDSSRVAMILAVLERRAGVKLSGRDVYAATVGGARLREPAADLAIAIAIASSSCDLPLLPGTAVIGEIGLAGEIRRVPGTGRRLAEAWRAGFRSALVPAGTNDSAPEGMAVAEVADVQAALAQASTRAAAAPADRGR